MTVPHVLGTGNSDEDVSLVKKSLEGHAYVVTAKGQDCKSSSSSSDEESNTEAASKEIGNSQRHEGSSFSSPDKRNDVVTSSYKIDVHTIVSQEQAHEMSNSSSSDVIQYTSKEINTACTISLSSEEEKDMNATTKITSAYQVAPHEHDRQTSSSSSGDEEGISDVSKEIVAFAVTSQEHLESFASSSSGKEDNIDDALNQIDFDATQIANQDEVVFSDGEGEPDEETAGNISERSSINFEISDHKSVHSEEDIEVATKPVASIRSKVTLKTFDGQTFSSDPSQETVVELRQDVSTTNEFVDKESSTVLFPSSNTFNDIHTFASDDASKIKDEHLCGMMLCCIVSRSLNIVWE